MNAQEACKTAISIAGGHAAMAKKLTELGGGRITRAAVHQWIVVPDRRVIAVETVINKQLTRQQLRPDLYPD